MNKQEETTRKEAVAKIGTTEGAIDGWVRYRDGGRVVGHRPDEMSIRMGGTHRVAVPTAGKTLGDYPDLDYYAFQRVEEAIGDLCKLSSQRETISQLLTHVHRDWGTLGDFHKVRLGVSQVDLLKSTLDAVYEAISSRLTRTSFVEATMAQKTEAWLFSGEREEARVWTDHRETNTGGSH